MPSNYLILGAGMQGRAIALDLLRQADVTSVCLADQDLNALKREKTFLDSDKLSISHTPVSDSRGIEALMRTATVCVSAVPYRYNEDLARLAITATCHFLDLGGNNDIVNRELAMNEAAKQAGLTIIPDCGLAPGMVSVLVAHGLKDLPGAHSVRIRVGGIPLSPQKPLNYMQLFNIHGLINEYIEDAVRLRGGKIELIPSLDDFEELDFPEPFGRMEAFTTSGGTSTLPNTYLGKVQNLDYKTIRYPGHGKIMRTFKDLGFFSESPISDENDAPVNPREATARILQQALPSTGDDVTLVRVDLENDKKRLRYQIIDHAEPEKGLSSMMRMTGFPAAIIAHMLGRGDIQLRGAVPQEICVPESLFLQALERRQIRVDISETDLP